MTEQIVQWDSIKSAIVNCKDIIVMGKLNYSLEAIQQWAKQSKQSLETQNEIAEYRIRLNRKQGEWIEANIPQKGMAGIGKSAVILGRTTLADAGIGDHDSPKFRLLAKIPEEKLEQFIKETKAKADELTSAAVQKLGSKIAGKAKQQSERMAPKLKRLKEIEAQGIYIGSVWSYGARENYAGDPNFHGNSPTQIVENSILLYTKEGDVVLDPMVGSGTTIDVCNKLNRQCIATDIKASREDIIECDARHLKNGVFEVTNESVDFIFLHPPYWKLVTYTKQGEKDGDLSRLGYQLFLDAMEVVFSECHRVLKDKKVLCLLIGDLVSEATFKPIAIPLYNQAVKFMTPIGIAIKTTQGSQSQVSKGKTVWAEVAMTQNLKIEHDFVMLFRKNGILPGS